MSEGHRAVLVDGSGFRAQGRKLQTEERDQQIGSDTVSLGLVQQELLTTSKAVPTLGFSSPWGSSQVSQTAARWTPRQTAAPNYQALPSGDPSLARVKRNLAGTLVGSPHRRACHTRSTRSLGSGWRALSHWPPWPEIAREK